MTPLNWRVPEPAAKGFGMTAELYEASRPTYPHDAIACICANLGVGASSKVVDLAAGTGKLTRQLVEVSAAVIALEPLAPMAAELRRVVHAPLVRAVAEAIAIRTDSIDAVIVGQAFHWFDGEAALAEIHRVLRPGGGLGLVWNMRDERVDWVARLGDIRRRYGDIRYDSGAWREPFRSTALFGPLAEASFAHEQSLDAEGVVDLMASRSYIAALDADEHRAVRDEIRDLLAHHPQTAGRDRLVLPYRTDVYWTTLAR